MLQKYDVSVSITPLPRESSICEYDENIKNMSLDEVVVLLLKPYLLYRRHVAYNKQRTNLSTARFTRLYV